MTLNLSCRQVFGSGQKNVRVFGPFEEVEVEVLPSFMMLTTGFGGPHYLLERKHDVENRGSSKRTTNSRSLDSTEFITNRTSTFKSCLVPGSRTRKLRNIMGAE
jgi:hypothetical protein